MTTKAKGTPGAKGGETSREATPATKAMLEAFHAGFKKSIAEDQEALEKAPKVHDSSKGEFIEEVDPKLADRMPFAGGVTQDETHGHFPGEFGPAMGATSQALTNAQVSAKLALEAHGKLQEVRSRLESAKTPNDKKVFAARAAVLKELHESHLADAGKYADAEAVVRGHEHGTGDHAPDAVAGARAHLSANYAANERRYKLGKAVRDWENTAAEQVFRRQQRDIQR